MSDERENLLKKANSTDNIIEKVDFLLEYARLSIFRYYDEGYEALMRAHDLSIKNHYKKGEAWASLRLGSYLVNKQKPLEAIKQYFKSLQLMKKINDKKGISRCHLFLGTTYSFMGNYDLSLEEFDIALKLSEKHDKDYYLIALNNLSKVFIDMEKIDEATNLLDKALIYLKKEKIDKKYMIYIKIATTHIHRKNYDQALNYIDLALENLKDKDLPHYNGMCNMIIAEAYKGIKHYKESVQMYNRALEYFIIGGDNQYLNRVYMGMSDIFLKQKNFSKALFYADKALNISEERKSSYNISKTYYLISEIYEKEGLIKEAFNFYKKAALSEKKCVSKSVEDKISIYKIKHMLQSEVSEEVIKNKTLQLQKKDQLIDKKTEKLDFVMKELEITYDKLIKNEKLIALSQLTDSFIEGIVDIIDLRDTTTSGHSIRIAKYCLELANSINNDDTYFKGFSFKDNEMKEIYYAALLHDVGKLGISENILLKKERLNQYQIKLLETRCDLIKLHLEIKNKEKISLNNAETDLYENIEIYKNFIINISNKLKINNKDLEKIKKISKLYININNKDRLYLLNNLEYNNLEAFKGNLTYEEWEIMKKHTEFTRSFLEIIPWLEKLNNVPFISSSHHEKLDGSGYPLGLKDKEIPLQTRILSLVDIFEALTASDRPYKKPYSIEKALKIVHEEVKLGKLDFRIYDLFIKNNIYNMFEKELNRLNK